MKFDSYIAWLKDKRPDLYRQIVAELTAEEAREARDEQESHEATERKRLSVSYENKNKDRS